MNKSSWIILSSLLVAAVMVGYALHAHFRMAALEVQKEKLDQKVDSLSRICPPPGDDQPSLPGVSRFEMSELEKRGAGDLKAQLFSSLRGRTDLIPYEGVLGGTMYFPSDDLFWILVHPWAMVYFEDGHRAGYLLLEYKFSSPEDISWEVIGSQLK